METKLLEMYKPTDHCNMFVGNSATCQAFRNKLYEFLMSYRYAVRSNVQKLKEILSACTNTAYFDSETSIDHVLNILNQNKNVPSMVKGTSFFQQSHYWTISRTLVIRNFISSRLKAFTTSGIIAFWERFCSKYCKNQPEHGSFHSPDKNSNEKSFKSQELESNLTSLFFLMLIMFAISILCFAGELCTTLKTALDFHLFVKIAGVAVAKKCLILVSRYLQRTFKLIFTINRNTFGTT
jgi:hypothetical protein